MFSFNTYYYIFMFFILFFSFKFIFSDKLKDFFKNSKYTQKQIIFFIIIGLFALKPIIQDATSTIPNNNHDIVVDDYDYGDINIEDNDEVKYESEENEEENVNNDDDIEEKFDIEHDTLEEKIEAKEEAAKEEMKVHFIDIGQGDSILLENPNGTISLIDGGPKKSKEKLIQYLKDKNIEHIDYVIATHPHEDHIGGLPDVLNNFNVDKIYMPNVIHTTKIFEELLNAIEDNDVDLLLAYPDTIIDEDTELKFTNTILYPTEDMEEDLKKNKNLNLYSIINRVNYGDVSFLFTGDAEIPSESFLVSNYTQDELKSNILKVGHHGSTTSTSEMFLEQVNPDYAIIMCEKNNKYGHPHKEVVDRLEKNNTKVFSTADTGDIIIKTNGVDVEVIK